MKIIDKFKNIINPQENYSLSEEEEASIADLIRLHPQIWEAQKKYFYGKASSVLKQLATCDKNDLDKLQAKLNDCYQPIRDFERIKENYLHKNNKSVKINKVKDLWYYITSQDVRDEKGQIKVTVEKS